MPRRDGDVILSMASSTMDALPDTVSQPPQAPRVSRHVETYLPVNAAMALSAASAGAILLKATSH